MFFFELKKNFFKAFGAKLRCIPIRLNIEKESVQIVQALQSSFDENGNFDEAAIENVKNSYIQLYHNNFRFNVSDELEMRSEVDKYVRQLGQLYYLSSKSSLTEEEHTNFNNTMNEAFTSFITFATFPNSPKRYENIGFIERPEMLEAYNMTMTFAIESSKYKENPSGYNGFIAKPETIKKISDIFAKVVEGFAE